MFERLGPAVLPLRVSEKVYTSKRDINVDYDALDYQVHIPTYNEEDYIEETLQSLVRQKPVQNGDVEIVLIDSHSQDDTVKIARDYVDRVIFADKGILTARNKGLEVMNPDVVLSADSADVYTLGWIDEHAKAFEDDSVVATSGPIFAKEMLLNRWMKMKHSVNGYWNLPGNNSAIRISTLNEIGNFSTDLNEQDLKQVLMEEQIKKNVELRSKGNVEFRPYATMYKSERRRRFSIERTEKYARQQLNGERF